MRTEIMDSSCNPTNEEEERMKKLPEKMRIKNNLFQKCYRGKKNPAGKDLISTIFTRRESGYNPTMKKVIRRIFNETKKETEELRHEKSVDTKEEKESRNIVKEEVDLNAPELSQEDTLFIDPMKTEIMDYSSNPKNGEDERIKKLLDKLRLRRTLNPICYRNKKKESEKDLGSTLFNRKESRYNPTVKEVIRRMLNETEEETEELRRDYVKFRSKIYQSRYRARVNGRLNLEMEKMLQMNVEKYMAKILLDYEEILNNRRLKRGLVQQFSSDNASQSSVDTREEQESRSIIKEEVDLDSSEFSQEEEKEEDTLFVDPMETEIMDSSSDPKNEEERIKKLLEQMRLRNRLYQRRFRERKKGCFLFDRKESLYNTTVKEAMRHILNKNKKETEKLRLDWAKFRKNICRIRYRAKLKGRLNLEVEKMIKMKEEKYLAKMILDYEKILNNTRLKNGLAQQLSIENASQSSMDTREEQESRSIVKEEVDLDASELLKEEEETLFVDPVKTEIMDSSSNPKNEVEERIKELLEKLKIKNNLFQTRYHDKKKECEKHFSSAPFRRKESRYNHTVKEVMRRISNKTEKGTEKLRLDWVQFRKKIYQIRYRARLRGRLNFEMEKMLQMKEVKYLAKLVLDYEKILNNPRLECGLVQQFSSSENVSQR
ncbi:trichohyalin-like [Belonocnema kinseyi]|uniref:trichohyalin-like n=1 Tax=Belonocnema kinseyi TaxID=2817044 RepID=UPI00143DA56E|nr:trichohyalin-like [Belonocnema kinseyi]